MTSCPKLPSANLQNGHSRLPEPAINPLRHDGPSATPIKLRPVQVVRGMAYSSG
jgi:hypothetical protein